MEFKLYTTLNKIREHAPCASGWEKLLKHLGKTKADDEPLSLLTILDSNGLDDALWCLRAVDGYDREIRLFAVDCARDVEHLMEDERSIKALDVAKRYANGEATKEELDSAYAAAYAAARAAALAAEEIGNVASAAALAAWDAALGVACVAARAAASNAARTAWDAARKTQEQRFRDMVLKTQEKGD